MTYKVNYKYYEKFRVVTEVEDTTKDKDVIFRTDGDLSFGCLPKNRYIFNNNGNVDICLTRHEPKTIVFDNDGDVNLNIPLNLTKCSILFYNRGKVTIIGRKDNMNYTAGRIKLFNAGDVFITNFKNLWKNWLIRNDGDVFINNIFYFDRNVEFKNKGNVSIQEVDRFFNETKFKNKGNIEIQNVPDLGEHCGFFNCGKVSITAKNRYSIFDGTVFSNKGDVIIYSLGTALKGRGFTANNVGDFSILSNDSINLTIYNISEIKSRGRVIMNIGCLDAPILLKNGGDVIMDDLSEIAHPTNVYFSNGGNVRLNSLVLKDSAERCPVFSCGGNAWVKKVSEKNIGKRIRYNGIIYTNDGSYFDTKSYIKRNNIPLKNGNMILYKGVGRNGVASYDKNPHKWKEGETYSVDYWNPYDKEIGEGKFVASYDTQIFKKFVTGDNVRYFAIEVNINDTFEYPFAKYPQLIGVRQARVLYEVDENKNKIESKNNSI